MIYILSIPVRVGGYDADASEILSIKRIRRYYNTTIEDTRVKFFFIFLLLLGTIG
jgi:hypothetical protein